MHKFYLKLKKIFYIQGTFPTTPVFHMHPPPHPLIRFSRFLLPLLLGTKEYYFLQKISTFNKSSLAYNIFSKNIWFLFLDKSQVQKRFDIITYFFCTA